MSISLPNFNVNFQGYFPGNLPVGGAPDFLVDGQLYVHSRMDIDRDQGSATNFYPHVAIRILDFTPWGIGPPYVKSILRYNIPGIGKFNWLVQWWEVTHLNFPNQYFTLFCDQCDINGVSPDTGR